MKRYVSLILAVVLLTFSLASCGNKKIVDTINKLEYCTLTIEFTFENDVLTSVHQKAVYTTDSDLTYDYSVIQSQSDYFTDINKEDNTITCYLSELGMQTFYPDATYDSVIANANENGLTVETYN